MDNGVFVFILNIIGGIVVFMLLSFLLSFTGEVDTLTFLGVFFFIQFSFMTTLLFKILHKIKQR